MHQQNAFNLRCLQDLAFILVSSYEGNFQEISFKEIYYLLHFKKRSCIKVTNAKCCIDSSAGELKEKIDGAWLVRERERERELLW